MSKIAQVLMFTNSSSNSNGTSNPKGPWLLGFRSSDKLQGLMMAATVDNVHQSAVYATEALGSIMVVDPQLIGKAVDILGGEKSFRLENLKLQFGLSSGPNSKVIRWVLV